MRSKNTILILSIVAIAAAGMTGAEQRFTDPGLVAGSPFPAVNHPVSTRALTWYPDRPSFQTANPGLPLETFMGTSVAAGGITACDSPLNSATNDACFAAGSVLDGFEMNITIDTGGGQYVVLNNALELQCVAVGGNSFVDDPNFDFNPAVAAVGVDLYTPLGGGETVTVEVFGPGGSLGSQQFVAGGTAAVFIGVSSDDIGGITRIEVREVVDSTGDLFCYLEFGGEPVPVGLQNLDIE